MKRAELNLIIERIIKKVLNEAGIYDKEIKNPKTGRMIKVSSALSYSDDSPVYKLAHELVSKSGENPQHESNEETRHFNAKRDAADLASGKRTWNDIRKDQWRNVSYDPPAKKGQNYKNSLNLIKAYYLKSKKK